MVKDRKTSNFLRDLSVPGFKIIRGDFSGPARLAVSGELRV